MQFKKCEKHPLRSVTFSKVTNLGMSQETWRDSFQINFFGLEKGSGT